MVIITIIIIIIVPRIFDIYFCTDFYYYNLPGMSEQVHSSAESAIFACTRILLCRVFCAYDDYTSVFTRISARKAKNASW